MPDRIPNPALTFPQRMKVRLTSPVLWFGVAATILAAAFLILAINLTDSIENKRAEDTCRSRLAGEVSQGMGEVSLAVGAVSEAVGDGLSALRRDDDAAAAKAATDFVAAKEQLAEAQVHLNDALAAREMSEETCDQR